MINNNDNNNSNNNNNVVLKWSVNSFCLRGDMSEMNRRLFSSARRGTRCCTRTLLLKWPPEAAPSKISTAFNVELFN